MTVAVVLLACSHATDAAPDPIDEQEPVLPDEPLVVTPSSVVMPPGSSLTLTLSGGTPSTTWRSSMPTVASVDQSGTVAGLTLGTASIWAVRGADSVSSTVRVMTVCAGTITVTPASMTLLVGDSLVVRAQQSCPPYQAFTWTSSNAAVATVEALPSQDGSGIAMARAVSPGTAVLFSIPFGAIAVTVR